MEEIPHCRVQDAHKLTGRAEAEVAPLDCTSVRMLPQAPPTPLTIPITAADSDAKTVLVCVPRVSSVPSASRARVEVSCCRFDQASAHGRPPPRFQLPYLRLPMARTPTDRRLRQMRSLPLILRHMHASLPTASVPCAPQSLRAFIDKEYRTELITIHDEIGPGWRLNG